MYHTSVVFSFIFMFWVLYKFRRQRSIKYKTDEIVANVLNSKYYAQSLSSLNVAFGMDLESNKRLIGHSSQTHGHHRFKLIFLPSRLAQLHDS
jgi:hypothetical protein